MRVKGKNHLPRSLHCKYDKANKKFEPRGGVVGWGTALQAGRSWIRFSMWSLGFMDLILPGQYGPEFDSDSNRYEYQG